LPPAQRISQQRVRRFVEEMEREVRSTSIATTVCGLAYAARLIAPDKDWAWLRSVVRGLNARANAEDRFDRLVPGWLTLDLGIELMEIADGIPGATHCAGELQYRDGLLIALLSLWPIRRRSIAALTVNRHLEFDDDGVIVLLFPEDTKSKRLESCRLPDILIPYLEKYLAEIRPRLLRGKDHERLWISFRKGALSEPQIYAVVRRRIEAAFGKSMSVHDFRRSAATFLAIDAPEKIGLMPDILQHSSREVGEQRYNLARSAEASRRHGATIKNMRAALRPPLTLRRR
jgi:integrase